MNDKIKKILKVLSAKQKKGLIIIFVLVLIGVCLEIFGIGLIVPLLNILIEDNLEKHEYLNPILTLLNNPTQKELILYSFSTLIVVYTLQ